MSTSSVRRWMAGVGVLALVALSLSGFGLRSVRAQAGTMIEIRTFQFMPASATVPVGSTVTWTNNDQAPHTATARDGSFDTGRLTTGQSKAVTLDKAGTFEYFCAIHPEMVATLTVSEAQQSPAPSASPSPAPSASPSPAPSAPPAATGPTPMVEANDQPLTNNSITVARVVAAQDGWIVIHTNTAENRPGPVIGHTAVKAGENANVRVSLSQTPNAGDKVWPMLHIDAGAIGTYEFPGPDAPVQVGGQVVMKQITVQAGATSGAPAGGAPAQLPNTGLSANTPAVLAVTALLLLAMGLGLRRGARRTSLR